MMVYCSFGASFVTTDRSHDRIAAVLRTQWKRVEVLSPKDFLYCVSIHETDNRKILGF